MYSKRQKKTQKKTQKKKSSIVAITPASYSNINIENIGPIAKYPTDKNMYEFIKVIYKTHENNYKLNNFPKDTYPDISKYDGSDKRIYFNVISEILLQSYLIYYGLRKMAEIKIKIKHKSMLFDIKKYILKTKIINYCKIKQDSNNLNIYYLYLSKESQEDEKNDNKRGISMAKKLGEGAVGDFYTCKTESSEWKKYEWRIVISCDNSEIFAQMCKFDKIADTKNMKTIMNIYSKILDALQNLDEKRFTHIPNTPNPLKINIYKTKVQS